MISRVAVLIKGIWEFFMGFVGDDLINAQKKAWAGAEDVENLLLHFS
jgi:hypothetical protein